MHANRLWSCSRSHAHVAEGIIRVCVNQTCRTQILTCHRSLSSFASTFSSRPPPQSKLVCAGTGYGFLSMRLCSETLTSPETIEMSCMTRFSISATSRFQAGCTAHMEQRTLHSVFKADMWHVLDRLKDRWAAKLLILFWAVLRR